MERSKFITIIGSMKFFDDMVREARKLHDEGYIVLLPFKSMCDNLNEEKIKMFEQLIHDSIDVSDKVLVLNKGGYIGKMTRSEIKYAMSRKKFIWYLEPMEEDPIKYHNIITICGSGKFEKQIKNIYQNLTMRGNLVFTPAIFNFKDFILDKSELEHFHKTLDDIHKAKIDMSDYILVVNIDGYIGEDTMKEIQYAKEHDVEVRYVEEVEDEQINNNI